ncbi:pantoate--beta-alanine ligase [Actinokineospora cianjurensis]|uniref:Pantothenate synthetase n=1 Tax=Actinokineospora cianjurensis TaxID=585224 RepID=A0A421B6C9_9PSEU|nr:pantoate--beta-alanine ligase [Actinokineospora cianjurensis]RLK59829.1 pantothenate synthetase [Actinokineospora cianjurensis]
MRAKPSFTAGQLHRHTSPEELAKTTRALRATGRKIAFVPTMGALHDGHRELMSRARRIPNTVLVVSIFVNPLQFGAGEDFDRYPRPLEADLEVCAAERVELVFTPEREALYPEGAQVTVHPGPLGDELEGAVRPGHFAGVLTVVAKLFNIVRPDYALFGEKDYQQLALIKKMVRDLDMDPHVIGIPTVRERDGLAKSSRNAYLDAEQRTAATALSAALTAGAYAGAQGAQGVLAAAEAVLVGTPELEVDYLALRGPDLGPAPDRGEARLLVAARLGGTRLIDNVALHLGGGELGTHG